MSLFSTIVLTQKVGQSTYRPRADSTGFTLSSHIRFKAPTTITENVNVLGCNHIDLRIMRKRSKSLGDSNII